MPARLTRPQWSYRGGKIGRDRQSLASSARTPHGDEDAHGPPGAAHPGTRTGRGRAPAHRGGQRRGHQLGAATGPTTPAPRPGRGLSPENGPPAAPRPPEGTGQASPARYPRCPWCTTGPLHRLSVNCRLRFPRPGHRCHNVRPGTVDEPRHHVTGTVPRLNLRQTVGGFDRTAIRRCRHVGEAQRIGQYRVTRRELCGQLALKTTFCRFEQGEGVMRHQAHDRLVQAEAAQVASTVQRVKPVSLTAGAYPMSWSQAADTRQFRRCLARQQHRPPGGQRPVRAPTSEAANPLVAPAPARGPHSLPSLLPQPTQGRQDLEVTTATEGP